MESKKDIWEIKHKTIPGGCISSVPYCGYDKETLSSMAAHGYELRLNGKRVSMTAKRRAKN